MRGVPFDVQTRSTGPAAAVQVYLEDGASAATGTASPPGALNGTTLQLAPLATGRWLLRARAFGADGCEKDRTELPRWVQVE